MAGKQTVANGLLGQGKWRAFLTSLVSRPRAWGHTAFWFPTKLSAKQYASNVRRGFQSGRMPPQYPNGDPVIIPDEGQFESTFEEIPANSGRWFVWARWMPAEGNIHDGAPATTKEIHDAIANEGGAAIPVKNPGRPARRARR